MRIQNHYQMIGAAGGMISLMQLRMLEQIPYCSVSFYSIISRPKRYREKEVHEHACMSKEIQSTTKSTLGTYHIDLRGGKRFTTPAESRMGRGYLPGPINNCLAAFLSRYKNSGPWSSGLLR